jgi:hypothetical protein
MKEARMRGVNPNRNYSKDGNQTYQEYLHQVFGPDDSWNI